MTPDRDRPAVHDALVARLLADARPVRPLGPPWRRLVPWLAIALGVIVVAARIGLRDDLATVLHEVRFVAELGTLLAAAAVAASMALHAAVPGGAARRATGRVALLLAVAWLVLLLAEPAGAGSPETDVVRTGLRCTFCVELFGALPLAALFLAVRRGAPLAGRRTAAWLGAAAFLVGAAAVRVACPINAPLHVLAWHAVPVAVGTALTARLAAPSLVRWRTSLRHGG